MKGQPRMERRSVPMIAAATLLLLACHRQRPMLRGGSEGQLVVATIDGQPLTVGEVRADLGNRSSYYRLQFRSAGGQKQLLKDVLDFEVLAKEAKERGYDQSPEVVRTAKQQMINELIQSENKAVAEQVSDAAVEQYYRNHLSDFTQGEAVKASAIVVKDRSKAEAVFVAASRLGPKDETGFEELVSQYSDDVESRSRGGRLGMIERSNRRMPAAVIEAAFALKQVGDVSKPVSTERGVFILRSSGRVAAQTRDLNTVKGQIVQRIVADSKGQKMDVWTGTIRSKHKVVVFDDKLDQLDLTAPETSAVGMR